MPKVHALSARPPFDFANATLRTNGVGLGPVRVLGMSLKRYRPSLLCSSPTPDSELRTPDFLYSVRISACSRPRR